MLPKSSKHFIKPTADKLGYDTELVDDAVGFFYKALRKTLVDMKGPNIQVPNFGSFKTKERELPKLLAKYNQHLNILKPETFTQAKIQKELQHKLKKVEALQKQILEEKARKAIFIKEKKERDEKQVKSTME
jgi:hypothetical protein